MYEFKLDLTNQRLDASVCGSMTVEEHIAFNSDLQQHVKKLRAGWICAVDLSQMKVHSPELVPYMQKAQQIVLAAEVGKMGTLLRYATQKMQTNRVGAQTGANNLTQRFYDRSEWDAFLNT